MASNIRIIMADQQSRLMSYDGFRAFAADIITRIKAHITALFAAEKADFSQYVEEGKQYIDQVQANYAGAVYLSQEEYDALTDEQKNDTTKVYFIEEQL